jgi:MFS family permease
MPSGVLQKIILLHRCVVVTPEAVLEFCQLPGEGIDCLGGKKMAGFAAGVIDSFQYYGSALCLFITGIVLERFGWAGWYPVMILFAIAGGIAMVLLQKKQRRMAAAAPPA